MRNPSRWWEAVKPVVFLLWVAACYVGGLALGHHLFHCFVKR